MLGEVAGHGCHLPLLPQIAQRLRYREAQFGQWDRDVTRFLSRIEQRDVSTNAVGWTGRPNSGAIRNKVRPVVAAGLVYGQYLAVCKQCQRHFVQMPQVGVGWK